MKRGKKKTKDKPSGKVTLVSMAKIYDDEMARQRRAHAHRIRRNLARDPDFYRKPIEAGTEAERKLRE